MNKELLCGFLRSECGIQRIRSGQLDLIKRLQEMYRGGWGSADEQFIRTSEAQRLTNRYREILNASCRFRGYSNRLEGVCDRVVGWREPFIDLSIKCWEEQFREMRRGDSSWLRPGANPNNYIQTDKSCRYYARVQNMPRAIKERVFRGCIDADMVNCHAQLFWRHILKGEFWGNRDMQQCIEEPEAFLGRISDSGAWTEEVCLAEDCPRKRSKRMRSKLFNPPKGGKPNPVGVKWYDDLTQWILERLESAGVDNCHKYFTAIEQERLGVAWDAVGRDTVVSNMHDGFIMDCPGPEVTTEALEEILQSATGMPWRCHRLGEQK
jgi:hypothetical protein